MDPDEIERMASLEGSHWWYRGLRDLLRGTLARPRFTLPAFPHVLDAGCGTGANLALLDELLLPAYLGGFDQSARAVELARAKAPRADLYVSDLRAPEIHAAELDLIVSCDVASICGIAAATDGLARLTQRLRRGGLLILHLPAYAWLSAAHDVAIGTCERTTAARLRGLCGQLELAVELITYRLWSLFPLVALARLPSLLARRAGRLKPRSDLRPRPRWTNAMLTAALAAENMAVTRGVRFPWGSSVYVVARKLAPVHCS